MFPACSGHKQGPQLCSLCTKFSIPSRSLYNCISSNSADFQSVMGAGFRNRHTGQWHEILCCSMPQLRHDPTLVQEPSTALCKEQRCASKDCYTEGPKMTIWAWPFVIHLPCSWACVSLFYYLDNKLHIRMYESHKHYTLTLWAWC